MAVASCVATARQKSALAGCAGALGMEAVADAAVEETVTGALAIDAVSGAAAARGAGEASDMVSASSGAG